MIKKIKYINIILIFSGYGIVSFYADFIGIVDSRIVTIPFRAISILIVALVLFDLYFKKQKEFRNNNIKIILTFWIFYLLKLTYDIYFSNIDIKMSYDKQDYFIFALGFTFLPMLSMQNIYNINHKKLLKYLFFALATISIGGIFRILVYGLEVGRLEGNNFLNPISYAIYLSLFIILGVVINNSSINILRNRTIIKNIINILIAVSFLIIFYTGSRGPLFSLVITLMIFLFYKFKDNNKFSSLFTLLSIIGLLFYSVFYGDSILNDIFITNLDRYEIVFLGGSDSFSTRDLLFMSAVKDFIDSPFFGNYFVISKGIGQGIYPHNIIIEAFMSTGIFVGSLFLYMIIKSFMLSIKKIKTADIFSQTFALFVIFLILTDMTSGSIITSSMTWASIMILYIYNPRTNY